MAREQHLEVEVAPAGTIAGTIGEAMPTGVRRTVLAAVGVLLALAVYLVAVRGEALLIDLQSIGTRMLCW